LLLSARDRLLVRVASKKCWSYEAPFKMKTWVWDEWVDWVGGGGNPRQQVREF
jgi:hypothetical protein